MIATDITGSSNGASQLLDLLSLVANPKVYEAKIKSLQDATELNRKYVEAVGPANEILDLRDKAKADRAAAASELEAAKASAGEAAANAKKAASDVTKNANTAAAAKKEEAERLVAAAQVQRAELESRSQSLAKAQTELDKQQEKLAAALIEVDAGLKALAEDKIKVTQLREDLRKKLDAIAKSAGL
jgi:chromosome segregation ATPase